MVPGGKEANERIAELWRKHPAGSSQPVLQARDDPRQTHVLTRGDFLKPAEAVTPGVPAFLHPLPHDSSWKDAQPTRLTFAESLVDRTSPTTAPSIVNRLCQASSRTAVVAPTAKLGTQPEPPSHPER